MSRDKNNWVGTTWVMRPIPTDAFLIFWHPVENTIVGCYNNFPHEGIREFPQGIFDDHEPWECPTSKGYEFIGYI